MMKSSHTITLLLVACLMMAGCHNADDSAYFQGVRSANKLVLAQMTISKMATVDDLKLSEANGMKQTAAAMLDAVKIGSRKAAYSYDTYLRAYVDLSEVSPGDVKVDHRNRTVSISLPPVQTEFQGRDTGIREDHYRVTGLRSEIDSRERAELKEKMNTALKAEVEEKPWFTDQLVSEAKTKAAAYFQQLLGGDGYTVTVKFKDQ
ncbi:MAG: DUF4230 domain-containing protein [Muribaculaceae bacterium]|nr:DUF4230 domain-containing protein [Muribaculaceae bacterium]